MRCYAMNAIAALVLAALISAATTNGLGINCRGSFQCDPLVDPIAKDLVGYINNIDPNRWYQNGEHIACDGFICAFLQNTGGAWGYNIKGLAHFITDHGCKVCGSVPYFYPSINDVSQGELTFNAASGPCTTQRGLC